MIYITKVQVAPLGAIYVGRPMKKYNEASIDPALIAAVNAGSPLQNPYKDRDAINRFRFHLWRAIKREDRAICDELDRIAAIEDDVYLACWCVNTRLFLPGYYECHADVVAAAVLWRQQCNQSLTTKP